jgi:HEAT repeat protein
MRPEGDAVTNAAGPPVDPIFDATEPVEKPTKRATLLFQFFLFPLMIVAAAVGVAVFFGAIAGGDRSAREYLDEVRAGGTASKQAAHQLAVLLQRERQRVNDEESKTGKPAKTPPFYLDAAFRADLARAFEDSFAPGHAAERRVLLAKALGFVGDPAYLAPLSARLKADEADVRRAVVEAIGGVEDPGVVGVLAPLAKDDDEPVRNLAVVGISRHGTPAAMEALRGALSDASVFVRTGAAAALALRGDASGVELLERALDPAWVESTLGPGSAPLASPGSTPPVGSREAMVRAMLSNGIRGALALRSERLRPSVQALTEYGPDPAVRTMARDALAAWKP